MVLPDYATAPRVRYPVPEQQVADVAQGVRDHAAGHAWDPDRFRVSRISAGAELAVDVCKDLAARGLPRPSAACPALPVLDLTRTDRTDGASVLELQPALMPRA